LDNPRTKNEEPIHVPLKNAAVTALRAINIACEAKQDGRSAALLEVAIRKRVRGVAQW